jgi:Glycosyltransferase family 87
MQRQRAVGWAAGFALVAEVGVLAVGLRTGSGDRALWTESVAVVLFGVAVAALRLCPLPARTMLLFVLAGSALLQAAVIGARAASSDDANRYVWDAKVQLAGIDPYRYPPNAPELARFRDEPLWPHRADCPAQDRAGDRCSTINRPGVRTIYPPFAEAAFVLARVISLGRTDGLVPLQILGALGVLGTTWLLGRRAMARGRPMWLVAVWAWCPMTAVELANNAHVDWLAVLFSVAALVASGSGRPTTGGALLGAAIASKLYPAVLAPALLRRRPVATVAAAVAVVGLSYFPHVLAVGTHVVSDLPDYLKEESYTSGRRFLLLRLVVPDAWTSRMAAVLLLVAALVILRRTRPDAPEDTAVVMVGVTFLVTTPNYGWYAVLLLALAAMSGRLEWLPLAFAASVNTLGARHFTDGMTYRTWCYAVGLAGVLILLAARRTIRGRVVADADERAPGGVTPAGAERD